MQRASKQATAPSQRAKPPFHRWSPHRRRDEASATIITIQEANWSIPEAPTRSCDVDQQQQQQQKRDAQTLTSSPPHKLFHRFEGSCGVDLQLQATFLVTPANRDQCADDPFLCAQASLVTKPEEQQTPSGCVIRARGMLQCANSMATVGPGAGARAL